MNLIFIENFFEILKKNVYLSVADLNVATILHFAHRNCSTSTNNPNIWSNTYLSFSDKRFPTIWYFAHRNRLLSTSGLIAKNSPP